MENGKARPGALSALGRHDAFVQGFGNRAPAALDLKLFVNAPDVFVGGVEPDPEFGGGFLDRPALDEQLQDFPFPR